MIKLMPLIIIHDAAEREKLFHERLRETAEFEGTEVQFKFLYVV